MKNLIITSIFLSITSNVFATELSWVDEQIQAIKPARKSSKIGNIKSPFIFLKKNKNIKKTPRVESRRVSTTSSSTQAVSTRVIQRVYTPLVLDAILNNTALINGRWYKQNDKIKSYTIKKIEKSTVILKNEDRTIRLSTNVKKQSLKFKNK